MTNPSRAPSTRTTVRTRPERGVYDFRIIEAILDEGLICHVGFVADGQPFAIPTIYARRGRKVVIHGAVGSRMLRAARSGAPLCITVTLPDGLVLARSAFHHSVNYRSVVILGTASEVRNRAQKLAALKALVEHVMPGRWREIRQPSEGELKATTVLAVPISEASAKMRFGPPVDRADDYRRKVWAGEIPLRLATSTPKADPKLLPGIALPNHVKAYIRARSEPDSATSRVDDPARQ
jgi:nitroimidazol reductase NimA-like FMN-containing flavoprotein (pyridoxamine 5'-phosphate oxidase superfamily)